MGASSLKRAFLCSFLALSAVVHAQDDPFKVQAALAREPDGSSTVTVRLGMEEGSYLYADSVSIAAANSVTLTPKVVPKIKQKQDPFLEKIVDVYDEETVFTFSVAQDVDLPIQVSVDYQGCGPGLCFPPETVTFDLGSTSATAVAGAVVEKKDMPSAVDATLESSLGRFTRVASAAGYLKPQDFLAFLDSAETGEAPDPDRLVRVFETRGIWLVVVIILMGGLALNLTPCVLPMIPINIAIIGAGAQAGSRGRGFALGGMYGLGIALVYGLLGLLVILTGSRFGTLNSSPWFNLAIAAVFLVMALAMFDIISIDFSRLQAAAGTGQSRRGTFLTALVLGGLAALLAGACVAPVLISVLLLSTDLYSRGNTAGLLLPFLLGIGMALPWPFAGAGLSFLPKPGKWMTRVKAVFGVLIILFAFYYGYEGVKLLRPRGSEAQDEQAGWLTSLPDALRAGDEAEQPVFVDFWASWCKNCLQMDKTTFKDEAVVSRLGAYVKVKVRAEDLKDPETKAILDLFDVVGLPTYVVLVPK